MNKSPTRILLLLGGFLGAGKTTSLLRFARTYADRGLRVGIITNDQAQGLVDTATFRSHGLTTEEVPGGCFCCHFNDLIAAADKILDAHHPDILLCEPVGSCTDIVATVIRPLQNLFPDRFTVAPYAALLDPHRAKEALSGDTPGRRGFTAKVTYIFKMQQHEADIIAINKSDLLSEAERSEIVELVRRNFKAAEILLVSANTGEGFGALISRLDDRSTAVGQRAIDVDYATYTDGEAALGWLNAEYELSAAAPFSLDGFLNRFAPAIVDALASMRCEPAHLKILLQSGTDFARVHAVSSASNLEFIQRSGATSRNATLNVNARIETAPHEIGRIIMAALQEAVRPDGISFQEKAIHAFRPAPPVPTHRIMASSHV